MKQAVRATLWLTCVLAGNAAAQGQSPPPPYPDPYNNKVNRSAGVERGEVIGPTMPARRRYTLTGRVVEVRAAENLLVIEQQKNGRHFNVPLSEKTKLSADKRTELADLPVIRVTDFKPAQVVKVTYVLVQAAYLYDPVVLEVRLRRKSD
jgi:hypothetical protein